MKVTEFPANIRLSSCRLALLFLLFAIAHVAATTATAGTFYWTNFANNNAYGYGSFSCDGTTLSATTTQLATVGARSTQEAEIMASNAAPTDNREAAVVASLAPGGYTAILRGKNRTLAWVLWKCISCLKREWSAALSSRLSSRGQRSALQPCSHIPSSLGPQFCK